MSGKKISARQLAVAVMVGGLSTGAGLAGRADWRWLLLGAALGTALGWLLLRRVGCRPPRPALRAVYAVWAVMLMARVLRQSALRIQGTSGAGAEWIMALLTLPLLWMGWGKSAAFFRAVEIFWLAMIAALGAILLLGLPRVDWEWALRPAGDWRGSMSAGALIMAAGLFTLPLLYKSEGGESCGRGLVWLGALGVVSAALALLTAGLLSPGVAEELDGPFFVAAGLLGDSARLEGLVSALWLLPDLTLAGLLSRCWGEERWPALAAAAALGTALLGVTDLLGEGMLAIGSLALAALALAVPPDSGREAGKTQYFVGREDSEKKSKKDEKRC